jgi:hypothetical protein
VTCLLLFWNRSRVRTPSGWRPGRCSQIRRHASNTRGGRGLSGGCWRRLCDADAHTAMAFVARTGSLSALHNAVRFASRGRTRSFSQK